MNKTKIEWCDYTWNPVTGCKHGCPYCYAEKIARRFGGASETDHNEAVGTECQWATEETGQAHDLLDPIYDVDRGKNAPYPFYFDPTFYRYRLDEPSKIKKPSKIFVVSMGDLFGDWVPDEWIEQVFKACEKAPQHTYIFLTKNLKRYADRKYSDNVWLGNSITKQEDFTREYGRPNGAKRFYSIEPLLGEIKIPQIDIPKWIIIGAQTGPGAVKPKKEWVQGIIDQAREANIPVFLKDNLGWPEKIQEFPEVE